MRHSLPCCRLARKAAPDTKPPAARLLSQAAGQRLEFLAASALRVNVIESVLCGNGFQDLMELLGSRFSRDQASDRLVNVFKIPGIHLPASGP